MDLRRIDVPVHVVVGTDDKVVQGERQGKALPRLLPGGRFTEVAGAGHMPHHSHPEAVIAAVNEPALSLAA